MLELSWFLKYKIWRTGTSNHEQKNNNNWPTLIYTNVVDSYPV